VELLPGERIIWTGEPTQPRLLRPEDGLLIPFSLVWGGFAIFSETNAATAGAPGFFLLWGVPFVSIGLYFIAGRFVVRAIALRHTRYTVTDLRVVITGGLSGRAEHASYLSSLQPPVIRERDDGTGDLAFGSFPSVGAALSRRRGNGFAVWGESLTPPIFRSVPMVRHVRDLVMAAQNAGPHRRTSIMD
jgi:hypothetical protein